MASLRTEGRMDQTDPILWTVHIGKRPILFIHGARDPYVPAHEVDRIVGHREAYAVDPVEYNRRVIEWFTQHLGEGEHISSTRQNS
jgi:fermentation-respiration switch protein FrsA (DUF1100 family)